MGERDELGKTVPRAGESPALSPRAQLPTQVEGRYEVPPGVKDPTLGRGGMGRVLALVDTHLHREVAVKELLVEHTAERSSAGPMLENLFVREARVLALLEHPGVVPVYELGRRTDGTPFYSMRRVRGRSLHQAQEQCVSLDERLTLLGHFIDVVQTIGFAHSKGVIHRDLKPENVMVSSFGETQVIDWGLAVMRGEPVEGGILAGTAAYMSPEQASNTRVDERSDVWALGVMLFELLSGELPFKSAEGHALLEAVKTLPVPRLTSVEPAVPPALAAVVQKALQKDASLRYQNAGQMAEALEAAQRARAPKPIALFVALGVLAVTSLGFGVFALSTSSRADDVRRDARLAVVDAQKASADALARSALAALRERDVNRAVDFAAQVPTHPLARGVQVVAEERGAAQKLWSLKTEAGCASVAVSGTTAACATFAGVSLWAADGTSLGTLSTGPGGWQHAVVATAEGVLVSGGDDRRLHVWDVASRKETKSVEGFSAPIRSLAFDGVDLIAGLGDGAVMRVTPEGLVNEVTKHARLVSRVAALPGMVASVSEGVLRVSGNTPMELDRHVGAVAALSSTSLVLGVERSVLVVNDGSASRVSDGHRDDVTALVLVPKDDTAPARLVSGSADGTVRWWFAEGTLEGLLSGFEPGVQALAATGDGRVLVATTNRRLESWKLPARTRPPDAVGVPSAHAWWTGSGGLVSGYRDGHVRRVDPQTGEARDLEVRHVGAVRGLARAWGPDAPDAWRYVSVGDDGRVLGQRWNGEVETLDTLADARVTTVATSREGELAAWAADDGTRVVWNLKLGKEVSREKDTLIRSLAFSRDGRVLAVGREDKHVELLDAQTGKQTKRLDPFDGAVTGLAFSVDGALLAVGSADGHVSLYDVKQARVVHVWNQPAARVSTLDFHSTGLLAAGSDDGKVWLFSAGQGEALAELPLDAGDVLLVAFMEDGLIAVGTDRVAHVLHP
jgi:WD40 repeat protein